MLSSGGTPFSHASPYLRFPFLSRISVPTCTSDRGVSLCQKSEKIPMAQKASHLPVQPFEDVSDAYFRQIESVSNFDESSELFHALRILACRIAEHRILMGFRCLREHYQELLHAGLAQNKNLTELTVGNIALAGDRWFYRPVQSVQPAKLPFLS